MNRAERNHEIVEHLRERFRARYGIELSRELRLKLIQQIHNGTAKPLSKNGHNAEMYRVYIYSNDLMRSVGYPVIFNHTLQQITTVLPPEDSQEYADFLSENGLDRDVVSRRRLTAHERTNLSVQESIKHFERKRIINQGRKRLKQYQDVREYFQNKA